MSKTENPRASIDWERIEVEYRAGIKTLREIAEEHDITHGAINKRAKKEGWERDLAPKIREKAALLVSKEAVSKEVSKQKLVTEREVVEANAQVQANIVISHRKDIQRSRALSMALLSELEAETSDPELFEQLSGLIICDGGDEKSAERMAKLQLAFGKVMSLPSRVDSAKKLAETLKTLVGLEREAFGIEASPEEDEARRVANMDEEKVNKRLLELMSKARK